MLQQHCKILEIQSSQNVRYKNWLKLLDSRGIKKQNQAILSGRSFWNEVLRGYPEKVEGIITASLEDLEGLALPDTTIYLLPKDLFSKLDIYGVKTPLLLITATEHEPWQQNLNPGLTIFLPFQNPINLGTCIRNAAALGAEVVLLKEAASPYLPKCLRASGPAVFQTPIWQGPSIKELAKFEHLPIYALSPKGSNLFDFDFPKVMGFVAGMEGPGLDDFWPAHKRLCIPMRQEVESLNAAVAVGMAMACRLAKIHSTA